MEMKHKSRDIRIRPVIMWAGMRRDFTRRDNNAAVPSHESVIDEIAWRLEHRQ